MPIDDITVFIAEDLHAINISGSDVLWEGAHSEWMGNVTSVSTHFAQIKDFAEVKVSLNSIRPGGTIYGVYPHNVMIATVTLRCLGKQPSFALRTAYDILVHKWSYDTGLISMTHIAGPNLAASPVGGRMHTWAFDLVLEAQYEASNSRSLIGDYV